MKEGEGKGDYLNALPSGLEDGGGATSQEMQAASRSQKKARRGDAFSPADT